MVRVDSKKPCKLVYSLCKHPYMGFVIEPHIVQLNANGAYSLSHQKLYSQTAKEFDACLLQKMVTWKFRPGITTEPYTFSGVQTFGRQQ